MRRDLLGFPALTSPRLELRPLLASDAEALSALTDDPVIIEAIPFLAAPFGPAAARELIGGSGDRDCFLGAWHKTETVLIGVIGAHLRGARDIEIGDWIGARSRRAGDAAEAAAAVLDYLSAEFPSRRIVAQCRPGNRASERVLEKLGLRPVAGEAARSGRVLWAVPAAAKEKPR